MSFPESFMSYRDNYYECCLCKMLGFFLKLNLHTFYKIVVMLERHALLSSPIENETGT